MLLPSRLAASTLGDLLGALHRTRTSGVVELAEVPGAPASVPGRRHRITLLDGLVVDVASEGAAGAGMFALLDALFALADAAVRFHVSRARTDGPKLHPREFLHGRPRARDRGREPRPSQAPQGSRRDAERGSTTRDDDAAARAALGVPASASPDDVRRAFRRLAKDLHPDRAGASGHARFAAISAAYHRLTRAA